MFASNPNIPLIKLKDYDFINIIIGKKLKFYNSKKKKKKNKKNKKKKKKKNILEQKF